jgi:hypothetical protein
LGRKYVRTLFFQALNLESQDYIEQHTAAIRVDFKYTKRNLRALLRGVMLPAALNVIWGSQPCPAHPGFPNVPHLILKLLFLFYFERTDINKAQKIFLRNTAE